MATSYSHSSGYPAGSEWRQHAESIHRAALRRSDAEDREETSARRQDRSRKRSPVRHPASIRRHYLSCGGGETACQPVSDPHVVDILIRLHSSQTENIYVHIGGCLPGRHASAYWLGRRHGEIEPAGGGALRVPVSLAIPSLHGYCVDVSRRLCSRWLSGSAYPKPKPFPGVGHCVTHSRFADPLPGAHTARGARLPDRNLSPQLGIGLLRSATRPAPVNCGRTPTPGCLDRLSAAGVRSDRSR